MSSTTLSRRKLLQGMAFTAAGTLLAACQPQVVEVTRVVEKEKIVEVEKEKIVEVEKEKIVEKTVIVEKVKDVTIIRWHARLGNIWKIYPERVKAFEEANPGAKVNLEEFPAGSAEFGPKIGSMIAAGVAGDLCWTAIGSGSFQFLAQNKALASIEEMIAADSTFKVDAFYPRILASLRMGPNGQGSGDLMALPELAHGTYQCLYFNKTLLEAAGLPVPTNDWTHEQLIDLALKTTKGDAFGYLPVTGGYSEIRHTTLAYGGEMISPDGTKSLFEDEKTKQGVRWIHDCFFKHKVSPTPQQLTGGRNQMFLSQKLALFQSGTWDLSIKDVVKDAFQWDMVLMSKGPAARGGHIHADGEAVLAKSKNKMLAYELAKTLTDHEGSVGIAIQNGLSCRPATYQDERVQKQQPFWKIIEQSLSEAADHLGPANLRKQESQTVVKALCDPLWVGDVQPDDAFFAKTSQSFQDFLNKKPE